MGYCVSTPVLQSEIRLVPVSPFYVSYLGLRFHYGYVFNPGWHYNYGPSFHYYSGPVVAFHHVTTYTPASHSVVTKEVIKQRTVINNGPGVRLPGKGVGTPQVNGVRLPGKDQPQAAPAGKTGFNFGQPATQAAPPAAAPAGKTGFNFNKAPAAAPAPKTGFNFKSAPASSSRSTGSSHHK
jgi:hypothetical protein